MRNRLSNSEISRRGHFLYDQSLRHTVETEANIGRIIVMDVATGQYEIDDDGIEANRRLRVRCPNTDPDSLFAMRIGYDAVFAIGSTLTKTATS